MSKKTKRKFDFEALKQAAPCFGLGILVLAVAIGGAMAKRSQEANFDLNSLAQSELGVSVDQLSELYVVADLSDALGLASAADVASSYVIANTMYTSGQVAAAGKLEKPNITDVSVSRGVIEYTIKEGDTMESIAAEHKISTDQIRWSNGMKGTAVTPGMKLYLPSSDGIVYLVKGEDTLESIAGKFGLSTEELIALNDLEFSGISEGMRIMVKGAALPEQERPEYVAPVQRSVYSYTYLGSGSGRENLTVVGYYYNLGGPYVSGQCTQWAWSKRPDLPSSLGNANTWAAAAARAGFQVDNVPAAGAIFQTNGGWYGHVGYVEAVNADGSLVVTEMNYGGVPYRVLRSTIPASQAGRFNYIH